MSEVKAPEQRPTAGSVETRALDTLTADGKRLRGRIPYGAQSRDMGGWTEVIEPTALRAAKLGDLVATIDHAGVPIGRYPTTLDLEDRSDGLHWAVTPPESRQDVREAVERGDLKAGSWRMVVGREEWRGDVRHVHEISELLDVSVVTNPAYGDAAPVELRTRPEKNDNPAETAEKENTMEPEDRQSGPGLAVEDRTAKPENRDVEGAIRDAIRDVPVGESRALTTAVSVSPGELSTTLFDKLRSQSVVLSSGAVQVIETDADQVTYPTITVDTAPTNYAEGATITPGDPTLATVVAVPQKIAHLVQLSNEVIDDSDPSIVQVVTDNLLRATAVKLDQQLIEGSGTPPQMTGMHLAAGVQTMASAAIMANFDWASDALALLEGVGGEPAAWFMASRTRAQIRKLHETATSVKPVMQPDGPAGASPSTLFGVPIYHSNQASITDAPGTATAVHLVAKGALVYVNRQAPVVEVDRSRLFNSDQSEIRIKTLGNLIAAIPNGIVRVTGLLPG